jgi:hypothetical protein
MNLQERIEALMATYAARGSLLEQGLFGETVLSCQPHATANPGGSETYLIVFASRAEAIFKPFIGQNPATCAYYQQEPYEVVLHEVAAWRLADAMGPPWNQLLPTAALRNVAAVGPGVVINRRRGVPMPLPLVLEQAQAQADAAALWDALLGQQDRHASNFRYEAESRSLALIDHGYAFALPGHRCNASVFVAERQASHRTAVHPNEMQALQHLLASPDLHGLRRFLDAPRADALQKRAEAMVNRQVILIPGAY